MTATTKGNLTRHQASVLFVDICEVVYGAQWQTAAAEDLAISLSSVVRYAKGDRVIPRDVFEKLANIVDVVIDELTKQKPLLNRAAGSADA